MIFNREPVLVLAVLQAAINAAVVFGLELSDEQLLAVNGVVLAVLSFVARQKVTPVP